jgi:hypothetical protein
MLAYSIALCFNALMEAVMENNEPITDFYEDVEGLQASANDIGDERAADRYRTMLNRATESLTQMWRWLREVKTEQDGLPDVQSRVTAYLSKISADVGTAILTILDYTNIAALELISDTSAVFGRHLLKPIAIFARKLKILSYSIGATISAPPGVTFTVTFEP